MCPVICVCPRLRAQQFDVGLDAAVELRMMTLIFESYLSSYIECVWAARDVAVGWGLQVRERDCRLRVQA
jgi:hypothetical protein